MRIAHSLKSLHLPPHAPNPSTQPFLYDQSRSNPDNVHVAPLNERRPSPPFPTLLLDSLSTKRTRITCTLPHWMKDAHAASLKCSLALSNSGCACSSDSASNALLSLSLPRLMCSWWLYEER